ncbi:MAG: hypothetical protein ACREL4_05030 [Gemmatimonadales bacterium]
MLQRSHFGLVLSLAAALGLAACGSKDTGPSFNGTISDGDAASFGGTADNFAADMLGTFDFGGPSISTVSARASDHAIALLNQANTMAGTPRRFRAEGRPVPAPLALISSACTPVISGDTADTDNDGILNNATETIDCTSVDTASSTTTVIHEQVHINDVTGLYGFNASVEITETETSPTESFRISVNESENALFTSGSANDQVNVDVSESDASGGVTVGGQIHENWNATFTASGTISTSSPLPSGSLAFTGGFYTTDLADATQNFNFSITTTTPLAYDSGCGTDPRFTSGLITGQLAGGGANVGFTVNYENGCGSSPTITGHGNAIS